MMDLMISPAIVYAAAPLDGEAFAFFRWHCEYGKQLPCRGSCTGWRHSLCILNWRWLVPDDGE